MSSENQCSPLTVCLHLMLLCAADFVAVIKKKKWFTDQHSADRHLQIS